MCNYIYIISFIVGISQLNDWDETTMRKSVLAGFDGKPRTIFRGWQVPHNDGATQKYRILSRTISEYSLLTHRRIEGSGSYSRMIRCFHSNRWFVPGRLRHGKGWQFPSNHRRRAAWCWSFRLVNDHHRVSLEMFGPCWANITCPLEIHGYIWGCEKIGHLKSHGLSSFSHIFSV